MEIAIQGLGAQVIVLIIYWMFLAGCGCGCGKSRELGRLTTMLFLYKRVDVGVTQG